MDAPMGYDFLPWLAQRPNMDLAAMTLQARLSAGQRGLGLDDLAPATVESIIKEAMGPTEGEA